MKMRQVSAAMLLGVQLCFSGCDTMHSLRRTAVITASLPATDELVQTLKSVHGVTSVKVVQVPARTYIALAYGPMKTASYYQILISSENASVVLTVGGEQGNAVSFSTLWRNHQPSDTERQAAAGLMDAVYDALVSRFPAFPPKTDFTESRDGVPTQTAALGRGQ